jgi:hypothetical protein
MNWAPLSADAFGLLSAYERIALIRPALVMHSSGKFTIILNDTLERCGDVNQIH